MTARRTALAVAVPAHVTVLSDAMTVAARGELGGSLPVRAGAETVTLLEERPDGTWSQRATFGLGLR